MKKFLAALAVILVAMVVVSSPVLALSEQIEEIQNFYDAEKAVTKVVNINIKEEDLEKLKLAGYTLCFAKNVRDQYNVVWSSSTDYLPTNNFTWTPQYEIFGSNEFIKGVKVKVSTGPKAMELGQTIQLKASGVFGTPEKGGESNTLTVINDYKDIHIGVMQEYTDINGKLQVEPIYNSLIPEIKGTDTLNPVDKVQIWFERDMDTGTMIENVKSKKIEVDLTKANEATVMYADEEWEKI
ncbi:MAG: hypothetical protein F6K54_22790 [Okeania sp. SIO3B5]|uniref:hypothetical protein n=1 Tax=Okeania sp. SIO3B5 TaxID=2607811 RepID=UPI001400EC0C|nr:hypothetical protein [Okeania sp. SIO3B5]NEO55646.1 hypothetical protein [Okeania sp. SIO3B5]